MRTLILALAATTAATPAIAQVGPAVPFSGLRAEGVVGVDRLRDGSGANVGSNTGLLYGGQVGFDVRRNQGVFGIEGEITGSTADTESFSRRVVADNLRLDAGRDLYVGGRIGAVVMPNALIYAKAGYSNARVRADYRLANTITTFRQNLDGFRVGAGGEYQFGQNLYGKAEYRYTNYSSVRGYNTDVDRHQVLAGVGFRF